MLRLLVLLFSVLTFVITVRAQTVTMPAAVVGSPPLSLRLILDSVLARGQPAAGRLIASAKSDNNSRTIDIKLWQLQELAKEGNLFANASTACQIAAVSDEIQHPCFSMKAPENLTGVEAIKTVCITDSLKCTDDQVSNALSKLASACGPELEANHPIVSTEYAEWYTYNLRLGIFCSQDSIGTYCLAEQIQMGFNGFVCTECARNQLAVYDDWKRPPDEQYINNLYVQDMIARPEGLIRACSESKQEESDSNRSSSLSGALSTMAGLIGLVTAIILL
jgi:hypothetical protein